MLQVQTGACLAFLITAAIWDWKEYRIPNWWILTGLSLGWAFSFWIEGWRGGPKGILGMVLPLVLLLPLWQLRVLGAGDLKLLMTLGCWYGGNFILQCTLVSFLAAGVGAAGKMMWRREMMPRLTHAGRYFIRQIDRIRRGMAWESYPPFSGDVQRDTIRFSLAVCIGYMITLYER